MSKTIAIVQSNYIPWKGYFDLIGMVDEFVLFDDMQYTRRDWRNRNRIKTPKGSRWLTIPVRTKSRRGQKIRDVIVDEPEWNHRHWKTIKQNYASAVHFDEYRALFKELYLGCQETYLSLINHRFLIAICCLLEIETKVTWSMDYQLVEGKTERLVGICKQSEANKYISGPSARGYIDESLFASEGIELQFIDYSGYAQYRQLYPPFEHAVSIIDLIFNEGPNANGFIQRFKS